MKLIQNVPIRDMSYCRHLSRSLSPSDWHLPVEKMSVLQSVTECQEHRSATFLEIRSRD